MSLHILSFSVASRFNFVVRSILPHSRKISTQYVHMTSLFVIVHLEIICLCNATTCLIYTQISYKNFETEKIRITLCPQRWQLRSYYTCLVIYKKIWCLWFYVHEFPNWMLIFENNSNSTAPEIGRASCRERV